MLELRHLRTLAALHETGSVSRAAKRVHLTQSALSHQIKALQTYYCLPMVQRRGQSVELTEAGRHLAALAENVLEAIQATERGLAKVSQQASGSLRIALECHTCFDWLMPLMDAFRQHWPDVELDLVSGFHSDPIRLLEEGVADVVIGSEQKRRRGIVHHPLFRFEILGLSPPLADARVGLKDADLTEEPNLVIEQVFLYNFSVLPSRNGAEFQLETLSGRFVDFAIEAFPRTDHLSFPSSDCARPVT